MTTPVWLTSIFVTTQFIQFHRWSSAPISRAYLSHPHRHLFKVRLELQVMHDEREVEYHTLLDQLNTFIANDLVRGWNINWSCEAIALQIVSWFADHYPDRALYSCTVSEDGENGSVVELRA